MILYQITFIFNCGVKFSSGESILGGGVCDLSSVSNGSPSERSSPFLGLCKINKKKILLAEAF